MFKKIYIEVTNCCNLNCEFCNGTRREKKFISKEEFKIVLDKIEGYTKYLYLHIMGEPLLHPDINYLIDEASKRYFINITSNGYLIKRIKDNINIRQINISLHSYNSKYKCLDEYMNDIVKCCDILCSNGAIINYRLWVDFKEKDDVCKYLSKYYMVDINGNENIKIRDNIYLEIEKQFIWPSYDNDYYNELGTCKGTRDHIGILVDGSVVPCCLDSEGIINLGNIYKRNLGDIIESTLFKEIRNGFLKGKKVHDLCKKCNFYDLRR